MNGGTQTTTAAAAPEGVQAEASASAEMAANLHTPSSSIAISHNAPISTTANTAARLPLFGRYGFVDPAFTGHSTRISSTANFNMYGGPFDPLDTDSGYVFRRTSMVPNTFAALQSMYTFSAANSTANGVPYDSPDPYRNYSAALSMHSPLVAASDTYGLPQDALLTPDVHSTTLPAEGRSHTLPGSNVFTTGAGTSVAPFVSTRMLRGQQKNSPMINDRNSFVTGENLPMRQPIASTFVQPSVTYAHNRYVPSFTHSSPTEFTLSSSQVAARHVLTKELPTFSGSAEDWPLFISNYEQSTERCGFSNQENLIRLQKSLKGPALEAVRGKLMVATMVPQAIETLRMLYGRPDVIHQALQHKLRQQPAVKSEKLETLIHFALAVQNYRATMEAIGFSDYLNDPILLNNLVSKLPSDLKLDWGRRRMQCNRVDIAVFDDWLFPYAACANQVTPLGLAPSMVEEIKANRKQPRDRVLLHELVGSRNITPSPNVRCIKCAKDHRLAECNDFRRLDVQERWKFIRDNKLCLRCFKSHFIRRCPSTQKCGIGGCSRPHNQLLHTANVEVKKTPPRADNSYLGTERDSTVLFHNREETKTLFRYVPVTLHARNKTLKTYALIDEGSSCTLSENAVADELQLDGPLSELCLRWTGDVTQSEAQSKSVCLEISSREADSPKFALSNVRTVANLDLPEQTLDETTIAKLDHSRDVPLSTYSRVKARILIGLDNARLCVPMEVRERKGDSLVVARCKLGWSVYGRDTTTSTNQRVLHICPCNNDDRLDQLIKQYFTLDSVGISATTNPLCSEEDLRASRIMDSTVKYIPNERRWEAGLLWKFDRVVLPDSLPMARRRLQCLEAKMAREPTLKNFLVNKIREYEEKGYVKKLLRSEISHGGKSWFIPIFTVTNVNKGKTRLVWDAAAKVSGISLNTALLKGPDLLRSLVGVLIRFREKPIAICGDIREMFHQIKVIPQDLPAQQFLWREGDTSREPDVYVMAVMTFGASCSPSLANYVKNKNAIRFVEDYPAAVNAIIENTFVDDWLHSVDTEDEMIQLASRVRDIHTDGGFEMRNWLSNSKRILRHLTGHSEQGEKFISVEDSPHEKVLGMWWLPSTDELTFVAKFYSSIFDETTYPTKRQVLRVIMKIFDPLGLLGFFVIYAKIIMQDVWRSGIAWDQYLQEQERGKWWTWVRRLGSINEVRVPRCYPLVSKANRVQLHTFVDASENAYAAVSYLRATDGQHTRCCLLSSKTRVAPLKPVSVPRLELMAAILGLRMAKFLANELTVKIQQRTLWTDSKNVLYWIRSDARKYHQFVALRLGEILEDSDVAEWRWVPSDMNVADDATKWSKNLDFTATSRWFIGPSFLTQSEGDWPETHLSGLADSRSEAVHHVELRPEPSSSLAAISPDPTRFSKWEKLRNTQRCVLKFLKKVNNRFLPRLSIGTLLNSNEVDTAELVIMRRCQEEAFASEMKSLNGNALRRDSSIYKLSPYIDDFGLLRVNGRIDASHVSNDTKRPIILPRNHAVSSLIVDFYHRRYHHHHNEIVVNELRQKFCIPGLRALVRKVAKLCQRCRNRRAVPYPPEMGQLPPERVAAFTRPFTYTGVDYFGPIDITVGRHREKRWGVLFTCLTVRAIHLEIASSLSTDCFLLVFKQFICRRGVPRRVFSDNGTNFRGASRILIDEIKKISYNTLEEKHPYIEWCFIPPAAPHMGGAWDRMVRSVKSVMADVLPGAGLREETLRSVMADVENIINSRPLTYVPLESEESEALTPNHFLLGSSNGIRTNSDSNNDGWSLRKNFRIANQIADSFWKRWVREYLPSLTRRSKWFQPPPNPIVVGDVVILVDENSKRNCWKKGIIMELHTGKDGQARSAVVKTSSGLLTRPVVKLAKLDIKQ